MTNSPSQSELAVLKHLWSAGAQSAREVQNALSPSTGWSYSTTRTLLLRMTEKGLVDRGDAHGLAVFSARVAKVALMGRLIRDFAVGTLDLDGPIQASAFASSKLFTEEEAEELGRVLEAQDQKDGKS